ncbi:MAG: double zinc ribbon domain-containing protein [Oscillospiraceae bacterium]|nr:double zinc ribbon domain-containing protein [Oscillospiraceae bacterium]
MGVFSTMLDLLFPPRCVFCRSFVKSHAAPFCEKCRSSLPYTSGGGAQKGDFFSVCVSPLYYEGDVRESMLRYKFKGATGYAKVYGGLLADCIRENLAGRYDLISWVPLSRGRLKERGYDQSMLLAMAAALELEDVAVSALEKTVEATRQSMAGSAEKRRANISGAYHAVDTELIADKRILLIDDIVTTGATLSECARTLRAAGAREVVCAAVCRARD